MKNILAIFTILTLGSNLFANGIESIKEKTPVPALELPSFIDNNSRSQEWSLHMLDSWGDG